MKPGHLFYLCHGNDVRLFGRVASGLLHPTAKWPQRSYDVIRYRLPKAGKYTGPPKWWSPSGNTTCWEVPVDELPEFEKRILIPFFDLRLDSLSAPSPGGFRPCTATEEPDVSTGRPIRPPTPFSSRRTGSNHDGSNGISRRVFDPDKIGNRTADHEACLSRFAQLFPRNREFKSDCDLLVSGNPGVLLIEVKTLRGDAPDQLRLALGQLLCYEHFSVAPFYPKSKVFRLVVTDREPPSRFVDFFEGCGIGTVWLLPNSPVACSGLGSSILKSFGAVLPRAA
jgi:hypothetical protein